MVTNEDVTLDFPGANSVSARRAVFQGIRRNEQFIDQQSITRANVFGGSMGSPINAAAPFARLQHAAMQVGSIAPSSNGRRHCGEASSKHGTPNAAVHQEKKARILAKTPWVSAALIGIGL